ncbi:MAG: histidine phosphatase family protein [Rhodobacteraceae bacterium]|nr:histidine phosphatase family protein [Paracoccaceae bacterium]
MFMQHDYLVLRHGETVWNQEGRWQGRMDSPLTARGCAQALRQKAILKTIGEVPSKIVVSPLGRALETARLALSSDAKLVIDDRIQEIAFGEWEGKTRGYIRNAVGNVYDEGLWLFDSPGGEDYPAISKRVKDFLMGQDEAAIIVTHGITSVVMRGLYLGLDAVESLSLSREQGCVYRLSNGKETILR